MTIGENEWNLHAQLIGRLMLAWTRTTHQLLKVFTHLTGLGSPLAETLYFSHTSDAGQRKLLMSLAETVQLSAGPKAQLKKLLKRLENVAAARNIAAHTTFALTLFDAESGARGLKVIPALGQHVDKRRQADVEKQFREANIELDRIYDDLDAWLVHTQFPDRMWGNPAFLGAVSPLGVPEPRAE